MSREQWLVGVEMEGRRNLRIANGLGGLYTRMEMLAFDGSAKYRRRKDGTGPWRFQLLPYGVQYGL